MPVLSIDLASRRYADIGVAVLHARTDVVDVMLPDLGELGLSGTPAVPTLARCLLDLAERLGVGTILVDGPQAWRATESDFEHQRVCERASRTPGKTGLPGRVKPGSWKRMAEFSIAFFDFLDGSGWPRYSRGSGTHVAIETFPTHAWRALGALPLPSKARRGVRIADWTSWLAMNFGVNWPRSPTHDEIQAVVAGLGGLALEGHAHLGTWVGGVAPTIEAGLWREGFIVSPTRTERCVSEESPAGGARPARGRSATSPASS